MPSQSPMRKRCASPPYMTLESVKIAMTEFLATQSRTLIDEIKTLLQSLDFDYYTGYNMDNISAIKFEYEFSTFDLVAYPVDKTYQVAGDIKIFLIDKQYDYFFPDNIEEDFLAQVDDTNRLEIEEELREYKYNNFENWFADCWDKAKGNTKLKGFFSIHDTMWVTNLVDRIKISEDTIPDLL